MAPAIETGDLYLVREDATVRPGDVIAFHSAERDQLVTHRVVGEKPAGYVTKGDANPSTDQQGGHPVVDRSAVVGTVVEVNGRPVTVGGVGPVASRLAAFRQGFFVAAVALLVALWLRDLFGGVPEVPRRSVVYVNDVVTPLFLGCVVVCLLFVFWGASTHDLNYVASAGSVTAPHTVPVGEAAVRTVQVDTHSLPFTTVLVEADGVAVLDQTSTATGLELLVEVPARGSTGLVQASVHVATYPATLPRAAIEWLHGVHWLAAAVGTIVPPLAPVSLGYLLFVDGRTPIRVPESRWLRKLRGALP